MAIEQAAWSALGFLNFTRAHFVFYQELLEEHADCQLVLVDELTGYPVAVGNCVPLGCDFNNLPPEGWDWIVETAANDRAHARNALGALAISVPGIHRSKGLGWQDDKGRLFDPWLRSHAAAGGRIIKPASRSMVVEEPVGFWEMWTGRPFEQSGEYAIDGALVPVSIDLDRRVGRYVEPNVWFAYAA